MAKRKRRRFTKEFKSETVRLIREGGKTIRQMEHRTGPLGAGAFGHPPRATGVFGSILSMQRAGD